MSITSTSDHEGHDPLPDDLIAEPTSALEHLMSTPPGPAQCTRALPWPAAPDWLESLEQSEYLGAAFIASTRVTLAPALQQVLNDAVDRHLDQCIWAVLDCVTMRTPRHVDDLLAEHAHPDVRDGADLVRRNRRLDTLRSERDADAAEDARDSLRVAVKEQPREVWDRLLAYVEAVYDLP